MSRPSRCNPRTVLQSRIGRQFQAIAGAPAGRPHAASTDARVRLLHERADHSVEIEPRERLRRHGELRARFGWSPDQPRYQRAEIAWIEQEITDDGERSQN